MSDPDSIKVRFEKAIHPSRQARIGKSWLQTTKEKFINFITDKGIRARQIISIFAEEYDLKARFLQAMGYILTGLMVWVAVTQFNTLISYILIIVLWEHYFPWIIREIKKKD